MKFLIMGLRMLCMSIPCLCLHAAPYFSCHHHCFCLQAYTVFFGIVIPTSFNILMKCFFSCFTLPNIYSHARAPPFCCSPSREITCARIITVAEKGFSLLPSRNANHALRSTKSACFARGKLCVSPNTLRSTEIVCFAHNFC